MTDLNETEDSNWAEALDWVLKIHAAPDNEKLKRGFANWLGQDACRIAAYERASLMWRLAGDVEVWKTLKVPEYGASQHQADGSARAIERNRNLVASKGKAFIFSFIRASFACLSAIIEHIRQSASRRIL